MTGSVRCSYICPIIIASILILSGCIMTLVGHFRKPFFSDSSSSWCDFCKDDTDSIKQTNKNLKVAGPIVLSIGVIILVISIIRCRSSYQNNLCQNQRSKFIQPGPDGPQNVTTTTRLTTYNTTGPSQPGQANTPYYPPQNQQQYPPATYPTGPSQYQSGPSPTYQPQPQGYSNTRGYGPPPPGQTQTPYPPMATGAPTPPYPPPQQHQESYPTKSDGPPPGVAPPPYTDASQAGPSAPPPPSY